jgi:hypothetical protein
MRALADIIKHLEAHVATGKLAKAEVKAKAKVN